MTTQTDPIFNFIVNALKIAGAPYTIINQELIMAQCQVNVPRTFFTPARVEAQSIQIVCRPDLLEKYPGSELVGKGSYRLQWLVDGIRKRGLIFKGCFPYDLDHRKIEREINSRLPQQRPAFFYRQPLLEYQPYMMVNFKVSLETDEKYEELYSLSINLMDGEIIANLSEALEGKKITTQLPQKHLNKKKIPYSEGFQALFNHLKWLLTNRNPAWIDAAKSRWEEEVTYLEAYYQGEQRGSEDKQSFYRQVADIYRKFRPVIRVEILNVGLLYLPVIIYHLEAWGAIRVLPPIRYEPLTQKIRWPVAGLSQASL